MGAAGMASASAVGARAMEARRKRILRFGLVCRVICGCLRVLELG